MKFRLKIICLLFLSALVSGCTHTRDNRAPLSAHSGDAGFVLPDKVSAANIFAAPTLATQNSSIIILQSDTANQSWERLNRTIARLGIPILRNDANLHEIKTDWISLRYDPDTRNTTTLPGLMARLNPNSKSLERHRFIVKIEQDSNTTLLRAIDFKRQREIDLAPDSTASFLEWKDHPAQAGAAQGFLARIQAYFESTVQSRLIDTNSIVPEERRLTTIAAEQQAKTTNTRTEQPKPEPNIASKPTHKTVQETAPINTVEKPARKASAPAAKPTITVINNSPGQTSPVTSSEADDSINKNPIKRDTQQTVSSSLKVLLIDNTADTVWLALNKLLAERNIDLQYIDDSKHILETQWIEARYDRKSKTLQYTEEDKPLWAFNFRDKGIQQHRFKIQVIESGQQGAPQSSIKVVHIQGQHLVDLTPDGSSTTMSWQPLLLEAEIADAYLRQLPIVVGP